MASIYSASIDLTKIDKSKITEKNGKKYYNISIFIKDEADQYGNSLAIAENQTKEESTAKVPKNYLGNGKLNWSDNRSVPAQEPKKKVVQDDCELPF